MNKAFQDYYPEEFSHCFGCGKNNHEGHQLKSYWDGSRTTAQHQPASKYSGGYPGYVYGGMIASLLDCHGTASAAAALYQASHRQMGDGLPAIRCVTASLKIDYLKPTPQNTMLTMYADIQQINGKKVLLALSLFADEVLCAKGEMLAIQLPIDENLLSLA